MNLSADTMLRLRRLSAVPRWPVVHTIQDQTVAEHSYQVAIIALWLAGMSKLVAEGYVNTGMLLLAALRHEEGESLSGDMAAPYKTGAVREAIKAREDSMGLAPMTNGERQIVKLADTLEPIIFLREEGALGNTTVAVIRDKLVTEFEPLWKEFEFVEGRQKPHAIVLIKELQDILSPYRHPGMEVST